MEVTVDVAKAELGNLIDVALSGHEVTIVQDGLPVAKIVPVTPAKFKIGILRDQLIGAGPNFLSPMTETEISLWE